MHGGKRQSKSQVASHGVAMKVQSGEQLLRGRYFEDCSCNWKLIDSMVVCKMKDLMRDWVGVVQRLVSQSA